MSYEELERRFGEELEALETSGRRLPLDLTPNQAWAVLAAMQLALHNGGLKRRSAEFIGDLARNIESRLCKTPAMQEIARLGWRAPEPKVPAADESTPEPAPEPKRVAPAPAPKAALKPRRSK